MVDDSGLCCCVPVLEGVYVSCIYRMPGGVMVGDSGPVVEGLFNVRRQLFERNYLFVDFTHFKLASTIWC